MGIVNTREFCKTLAGLVTSTKSRVANIKEYDFVKLSKDPKLQVTDSLLKRLNSNCIPLYRLALSKFVSGYITVTRLPVTSLTVTYPKEDKVDLEMCPVCTADSILTDSGMCETCHTKLMGVLDGDPFIEQMKLK